MSIIHFLEPTKLVLTIPQISDEYEEVGPQLLIKVLLYPEDGLLCAEATNYCIDDEPWKPIGKNDFAKMIRRIVKSQLTVKTLAQMQCDHPMLSALCQPEKFMTQQEFQDLVL